MSVFKLHLSFKTTRGIVTTSVMDVVFPGHHIQDHSCIKTSKIKTMPASIEVVLNINSKYATLIIMHIQSQQESSDAFLETSDSEHQTEILTVKMVSIHSQKYGKNRNCMDVKNIHWNNRKELYLKVRDIFS